MKKVKKQILTYEEFFIKNPNIMISTIILGHLQIEFVLKNIVKVSNPNLLAFCDSLNHYRLIELVFGLNLIDAEKKEVLIAVNKLRNKFAHILDYEPSLNDFLTLFRMASSAFSDMTCGIEQGLYELNHVEVITEEFDTYLADLMNQILYDLHQIYCDNGGSFDVFE